MPNYPFSRCLRAWVLAWLLAALGIASAAPLMHAGQFDWVCSASGKPASLQAEGSADGSSGAARHASGTLECPDCLLSGAPPSCAAASPQAPPIAARLPLRGSDANPAQFTTVPPPARGPPTSIPA
ncbi:hypothetical protein HNP55_002728 [Paucibacter oligotrophus]|uniref:DUF2946 family protein n=1 Tax=Roseateles oligotrophus TaxID=1769250 RepID=A0A840LC15_9BURK|nr:hypothetical protein [Roseateles oligotrophus]MBB4844192.1 hypothetical protein [Roseateles oligotrophus]